MTGDRPPVNRVARRNHAACPVAELRGVVARKSDGVELQRPEADVLAGLKATIVEAPRRRGVREHLDAVRAQLADAGHVILVCMREQGGVDLKPFGIGVLEEWSEVPVAVDQDGVALGADEIGAGIPDSVARCDDRYAGPADTRIRQRVKELVGSRWHQTAPSTGFPTGSALRPASTPPSIRSIVSVIHPARSPAGLGLVARHLSLTTAPGHGQVFSSYGGWATTRSVGERATAVQDAVPNLR